MSDYRRWTKQEDEALRMAGGKMDIPSLANELNRTISAVENRAFHLGVSTATRRKRHKGNSPVKQKHIDEAVALYKQHGKVQAASDASTVPYGRMCYLMKLARLYGVIRPKEKATPLQLMVLGWIKANPGKKRAEGISYFRRMDYGYATVERAYAFLKRQGMIEANSVYWYEKGAADEKL
jgi:hypothetical protein